MTNNPSPKNIFEIIKLFIQLLYLKYLKYRKDIDDENLRAKEAQRKAYEETLRGPETKYYVGDPVLSDGKKFYPLKRSIEPGVFWAVRTRGSYLVPPLPLPPPFIETIDYYETKEKALAEKERLQKEAEDDEQH